MVSHLPLCIRNYSKTKLNCALYPHRALRRLLVKIAQKCIIICRYVKFVSFKIHLDSWEYPALMIVIMHTVRPSTITEMFRAAIFPVNASADSINESFDILIASEQPVYSAHNAHLYSFYEAVIIPSQPHVVVCKRSHSKSAFKIQNQVQIKTVHDSAVRVMIQRKNIYPQKIIQSLAVIYLY